MHGQNHIKVDSNVYYDHNDSKQVNSEKSL